MKEREIERQHQGVNFINVFTYKFFVQTLFWQLFPRTRNIHATRKSCRNDVRVKNHASIKLMKLTPTLLPPSFSIFY